MVACMLRICAAAATPWAWLPEENATTPPLRLSCGIEASLLKAPRNLNDPVRCSISGFRKTLVPTRSLRTGNDKSGVRTANGATTLAAASISATPMGGFWMDSAIRNLYRARRRAGKTIQRDLDSVFERSMPSDLIRGGATGSRQENASKQRILEPGSDSIRTEGL